MDTIIFTAISLLGGLAFFLYGMQMMSHGLERVAGGRLESVLRQATSTPLKGLLLGTVITCAIQSSSATTVMLVGLVNSGIMKLGQTVGVIMGSNIGTTITAWILSLAGIESSNLVVQLFKLSNIAPLAAVVGILMVMFSKRSKRQDLGTVLIGFALLMAGMGMMSDAMKPFSASPAFSDILTAFENPILGILVGMVLTMIIQSSSAAVGILQALALAGGVTYGMAIPLILGMNIGTCITAVLSSIGANPEARRVPVLHTMIKVIGVVVFSILFYSLLAITKSTFLTTFATPWGVALSHTIFNLFNTALLLPFQKQLLKAVCWLVKDTGEKKIAFAFIDDRLFATPSLALAKCADMTREMSRVMRDTVLAAMEQMSGYQEDRGAFVVEGEDKLDIYEDKLGTALVKIAGSELSNPDSRLVSRLLHTIGDFERIGDHSRNVEEVAKEMYEKSVSFSPEATEEVRVIASALTEIIQISVNAFETNDVALAMQVEPLEEVIDFLIEQTKNRHINRLRAGRCTIELGFILSDLLTNYERISDHCSNIAVCIIETSHGSFDTHEYQNAVKARIAEGSDALYSAYSEKYQLPN